MAKYRCYARVSTKDQSDHSIENQLKFLKVQAEMKKMAFVEYFEKQSGKNVEGRNEFKKALNDLQEGDILGVYDNSRLGRNTEDNLRIVKEASSKGAFVAINGKVIDINIPQDKLLLTVDSAFSTYQRETQNLKSRIGLDTVKEKGEWIFTSRLYGYKVTGSKKNPSVEIVDHEAEIIRFIFSEYASGNSVFGITEELNRKGYKTREGKRWYAATIRRTIHKPIYYGYYKVKGGGNGKGQYIASISKDNLVRSKYYPPIIDEGLFWKVNNSYQTLRRTHSIQLEYRYSKYELSSVVKCGYCGQSYIHSHVKRKNDYYEVYSSTHCEKGCGQEIKTLRLGIYEPLFHQIYFLSFLWMDDIQSYFNEIQEHYESKNVVVIDEINNIEKNIQSMKIKVENLYDAIEQGLNKDRIIPRILEKEEEIKVAQEEISNLKNSLIDERDEIEELLDNFSDENIMRFIKGNPKVRREAYQSKLEVINKGKVLTVKYKTGMRVEIQLYKNAPGKMQRVFDLRIFRNNKLYTTITYNTESGEFTVNEKGVKKKLIDDLLQALIEKRDFALSLQNDLPA